MLVMWYSDGVSRHHRFAKLALVDGEKIHRARLLGAHHREDTDDAGGLRHGLDHHHPRIHRPVGKMAEERHFVEGDILDADAAVVGPYIDDPIDQQHRIAMRKRFQDGVDIHHLDFDRRLSFACLAVRLSRSRSRSTWRHRAPAARRRRSPETTAASAWQRSRPSARGAGTSSLTPLIAVICAPVPDSSRDC